MLIHPDIVTVLQRLNDPERDALERLIARAEKDGADMALAKMKAQAQPPTKQKPAKVREKRPDGLMTLAEGAAKLRCSLKTLKGHIASGALTYVSVGHGNKRQRKMLADADLTAFITHQARKDVPCPSTRTRARRIGNSTSGTEVIAFSAQPGPRPSAKPKR